MIPIFFSSEGLPFFNSGIFVIARSAKNECISPCLCGLSIHSLKSFLSFFMAAGKSKFKPSSTDLIILCGENKFLYFFKALAFALVIISFICSRLSTLLVIFEVGLTSKPSLINFRA